MTVLFRPLLLGLLVLACSTVPAWALEPFVASYQAYNEGKLAGSASMKVVPKTGSQWQIDLDVKGTRGFAAGFGAGFGLAAVFGLGLGLGLAAGLAVGLAADWAAGLALGLAGGAV